MPADSQIVREGMKNPYLETIGGEAGKYGPETRLQLLRFIAEGKMLGEACRALNIPKGAPYWWGCADPRYRVALNHARKAGAATLAGEVLEVADAEGMDRDQILQAKLRVHARQWLAGRLDPEQWGDRQTHTVEVTDTRRTAFVSFLGERPIVEVEATVKDVDKQEQDASSEASRQAGANGANEPKGDT